MKHFFRPLTTESLRPEERDAIRHTLKRAMATQPLASNDALSLTKASPTAFFFTQLQRLTPKPMFATIFLAILIALGGGTAAAAENAAPGDALYPFKIHINESVRGAIAVGTDAEADWQSTRAVRRLEEAAHLAAEGRLDNDTREKLRARFAAHQEKAERLLADLNAKGNTEAAAAVSAHMEAKLSAYNEVLTALKRSRPTSTDILSEIRAEVKTEAEQAASARSTVETSVKEKTKGAAEGRMKAAENKISEVRKYIENKKMDVDASAITQARAQLKLAEEKIALGKTSIEKEQYGEAFIYFGQAHTLAEKAKLTLKTIDKLNISLFGKQEEKDDNKNSVTSTTAVSATTSPTPSVTASSTTEVKTKLKLPLKVKKEDKEKKDADSKELKINVNNAIEVEN